MFRITISQWGLIFDIIGVIFLFKFGLPSEIESEKGPGFAIGANSEDLKKIKAHNRKIRLGATIGLTLIILGFLFQFLGGFKK